MTTTQLDHNKVFIAKMTLRYFLETMPKGMVGDAWEVYDIEQDLPAQEPMQAWGMD